MASIVDFKEISLDDLEIDTGQVRNTQVGKDLDDLVASISKVGLLEPIVVCPSEQPGRFSIITGQRRYLAHRQLQKPTIWAAILDERLSEIDAKVLSVTENIVRTDLPTQDLIDVCTYLYKHYGTFKAVSEKTGLSSQKVSRNVKYERLDEPLKVLVDDGEVDMQTALRAQDAAEAGENTDSAELVKLAREMTGMSDAQRRKIVKDRQDDPTLSADEAIEDAKSGGKITQVMVTLSSEVHAALGRYAKSEGANQDAAAAQLIRDGLFVHDYISENDV